MDNRKTVLVDYNRSADEETKKYVVEFEGPYYDGGLYEIGRFATKREAVACIQSRIDNGTDRSNTDPHNYRIIVEITFRVKEKK